MAQKRAGRGRARRGARSATGFPTKRKPRRSKAPSTSEPTAAFEALMQVTSAEYERLNSNNNSDNRSDSSSRSTEENRNVYAPLSSPSDVRLPAWYGAPNVVPKPMKNELILPPKKKKYLHYLAEADDDNKIINDPFQQPEPNAAQQWAVTSTPQIPYEQTNREAAFAVVPEAPQGSSSRSPEQLAPLKFNPTPLAIPTSIRPPETGKTFSDVLDEHIARLIVQNDHIVSNQPVVSMSKRGRSRDSRPDLMDLPPGDSLRPPVTGSFSDSCMVKNLLSSKLTRKTLAKEIAEQRPQPGCGNTLFSYLNPENSAIKNLLIKTYEENGMTACSLPAQPEIARSSNDFKTPEIIGRKAAVGCAYGISSDSRAGALVVPDVRVVNGNSETMQAMGWTVLPGNEWVFVDERGRKRVRPEMTVVPETATYHQAVASGPVRSPSADSAVSSESIPSSGSLNGSLLTGRRRVVQTNGTFQPFHYTPQSDSQIIPSDLNPFTGVVRTIGTFHPNPLNDDRRPGFSEHKLYGLRNESLETGMESLSHEKALNALRGHLTGKRPAEEAHSVKSEESSFCTSEPSMLPPKKRKSFHMVEKPVVTLEAPVQTISPPPAVEPSRRPSMPQARMATQPQQASKESSNTTVTYSGYATYVNENHPSQLNFYSDLSRRYSTNLAFAQTLLLQGHYYPSFRYSCVTTNTTRTSRPIPTVMDSGTSLHSQWLTMPSAINPSIVYDSSVYGKKKLDGNLFTNATKKVGHVGATSVETYNRKQQLIHMGMNSFLPVEGVRLAYADVPAVRKYAFPDEHSGPSTSRQATEPRTWLPDSQNVLRNANVEDVSEDEEESDLCVRCRKIMPPRLGRVVGQHAVICTQCVNAGKRASISSRKDIKKDIVLADKDHSEEKPKVNEKQFINQRIHQKIISHKHSAALPGPHHVMPEHPPQFRREQSTSPTNPNPGVMDLSVRKPSPPLVVPNPEPTEWKSYEGSCSRFPCQTCGKIFPKESQLSLHNRVHDLESPGKSDKKSNKNRRERSTSPSGHSHGATNENPRPFCCAECQVGFRIHGHLQKHLRSKTHITQLECLGRLQCGFYAELERQNKIPELQRRIDTADCSKAFTCLVDMCKNVMPTVAGNVRSDEHPIGSTNIIRVENALA